ncbi:hypothetical protein LguiA_008509 [Lonicera macranthoides]
MSSLRARPNAASVADVNDNLPDTTELISNPSLPSPQQVPSFSQRAVTQTLTSAAHLANHLPTGTLLALQLLTPIFTHNGSCDSATRPMTFILLSSLAIACFIASLTDSFKSSDGRVFYGLATFKGMWLFDYQTAAGAGLPDLSKYKLRFVDWIHAVVSAFVLIALALRDRNVVNCFYPRPSHETQEVLDIVPLAIGMICSLLFVIFPTRRHGIGYPVTPDK